MAKRNKTGDGPVIIKKYANRRLYNTQSSSYVTLDHLAEMVRDDVEFQVFDAKSGEDITRSVLAQIIFEAEGKGQNILPVNFLRQLISFYGDNLQTLLPSYLDMSMNAFSSNREEIREQFGAALGEPMKQFEDAARRNMQFFEQTMGMFNPFMAAGANPLMNAMTGGQAPTAEPAPAAAEEAPAASGGEDIEKLKDQLDAMQNQLNQLLNNK